MKRVFIAGNGIDTMRDLEEGGTLAVAFGRVSSAPRAAGAEADFRLALPRPDGSGESDELAVKRGPGADGIPPLEPGQPIIVVGHLETVADVPDGRGHSGCQFVAEQIGYRRAVSGVPSDVPQAILNDSDG